MKPALPRTPAHLLLVALQFLKYVEDFEAIDDFNPFDGSTPPEANQWDFTGSPDRLHRIFAEGFGIKQKKHGFDHYTLPHSCFTAETLDLLITFLQENPALGTTPIDVSMFLADTSESEGDEQRVWRESFVNFLTALAEGRIKETFLKRLHLGRDD